MFLFVSVCLFLGAALKPEVKSQLLSSSCRLSSAVPDSQHVWLCTNHVCAQGGQEEGSLTFMLRQGFPQALVVNLDLNPGPLALKQESYP